VDLDDIMIAAVISRAILPVLAAFKKRQLGPLSTWPQGACRVEFASRDWRPVKHDYKNSEIAGPQKFPEKGA
jgi:hypothetical protein